ncbi:hypothetical protein [Pseudomonas antarctica]|uniref:hypothetical protein n=1 Tax=Pseudomonas antarctica TaxID=219572 RepID=UPI003F74FFC1
MTTNTSGSTLIGLSVVPSLPAPKVQGVGSDGVVPATLIAKGLRVELTELWTYPAILGESDYVVFVWAPDGAATYKLPAIELKGPVTLPVYVTIPPNYLQKNEVVQLSYEIHSLFSNSNNYETSANTQLKFDTIAPGANGNLSAPESIIDPITDSDLQTSPTIDFRVLGDYWGRAPGDTILFWVSANNALPTGLPTHKQTFSSDSGEMIVNIPVAEILKLSAHPVLYLFYKVMDASLNTSLQFSFVGKVDRIPSLPAPGVPAYDLRGIINRDAARSGVVVSVNYPDFQAGDQCVVNMGVESTSAVTVTSLPLNVPIEWKTLIANGANIQRNNNLRVTYTISRAGASLASGITSSAKLIDEDQRVAGIENPLAPILINGSLDSVTIFGAVSNKANYLDTTDAGKGVRASFKLFKNPKVGERALLYWPNRSDSVATYTVVKDDVEGMVKDFDTLIPWQDIQNGGTNANTLVYYQTDNGVNQQQSPNTVVSVSLAPLVRFARPTFPQSFNHPRRFLNCDTKPVIWDGVEVLIDPAPHVLQAGDKVLLTWQGFRNYPDRNPIPETFEVLTFTWAGTAAQKFVVTNYEKLIRPLNDFSGGSAKYQVLRNNVMIGESVVGYVQIDRKYPGSGNYCGPKGNGPLEK